MVRYDVHSQRSLSFIRIEWSTMGGRVSGRELSTLSREYANAEIYFFWIRELLLKRRLLQSSRWVSAENMCIFVILSATMQAREIVKSDFKGVAGESQSKSQIREVVDIFIFFANSLMKFSMQYWLLALKLANYYQPKKFHPIF